MLKTQPPIDSGDSGATLARALLVAAAVAIATIGGGCMNSIQTPLPDVIRPPANASLSDKERKEAVDELAKKRDTHDQDAQQQIEQSR
jgi:hypothetical protein